MQHNEILFLSPMRKTNVSHQTFTSLTPPLPIHPQTKTTMFFVWNLYLYDTLYGPFVIYEYVIVLLFSWTGCPSISVIFCHLLFYMNITMTM